VVGKGSQFGSSGGQVLGGLVQSSPSLGPQMYISVVAVSVVIVVVGVVGKRSQFGSSGGQIRGLQSSGRPNSSQKGGSVVVVGVVIIVVGVVEPQMGVSVIVVSVVVVEVGVIVIVAVVLHGFTVDTVVAGLHSG